MFTANVFGATKIDLSKAKIVVLNPKKTIYNKAADMLADEIDKRTRIGLEVVSKMPAKNEVATDLRQRVFELAEALFQSIRMQHSVKKYHSQRYANLDDIDEPLNDREDMEEDFDDIRKLGAEDRRLAKINQVIAEYSAKLAAYENKTAPANWPDWTIEFDKYQRKRSGLFKPYFVDQANR